MLQEAQWAMINILGLYKMLGGQGIKRSSMQKSSSQAAFFVVPVNVFEGLGLPQLES